MNSLQVYRVKMNICKYRNFKRVLEYFAQKLANCQALVQVRVQAPLPTDPQNRKEGLRPRANTKITWSQNNPLDHPAKKLTRSQVDSEIKDVW